MNDETNYTPSSLLYFFSCHGSFVLSIRTLYPDISSKTLVEALVASNLPPGICEDPHVSAFEVSIDLSVAPTAPTVVGCGPFFPFLFCFCIFRWSLQRNRIHYVLFLVTCPCKLCMRRTGGDWA